MPLSSAPVTLVPSALVRKDRPPPPRSAVRVIMLKDGRGMTSHGRRPELVTPSAGDSLDVSSDLADNWQAAGFCRSDAPKAKESLPRPPETAETVPPETAKGKKRHRSKR